MNEHQQSLQELHHIKQMMEKSSRFISLSGLSGISAGICALAGYFLGVKTISKYVHETGFDYEALVTQLVTISGCVLTAALISAFIFTYVRSKKNNVAIWGATTYRLLFNLAIPLFIGGVFLLRILQLQHYFLIAPVCLLFYGLALVNASRYTLVEIRYLGYCELALGIINLWVPGYGLIFWATGFGLLHIFYGGFMWWKYERRQ
jgi:hypothetical protein